MNHDEIVLAIKKRFPKLTTSHPERAKERTDGTSFWIPEMAPKLARVVRIKNNGNLKCVASGKSIVRNCDFSKKRKGEKFDGSVDELIDLVRGEVKIVRQWAKARGVTLSSDTEKYNEAAAIEKASGINRLIAEFAKGITFNPGDEQTGKTYIAQSIALRSGQSGFRENLLSIHGRKCCISGCSISQILEAAHIVPFNGESTNNVENGLVLRSDLHTLFDCGLVRINPETYTVVLAAELLNDPAYKDFDNNPLPDLEMTVSKAALKHHFERFE